MDFVNKRSLIRVNVNMPVILQLEHQSMEKAQALAINISIDGVFLMSEEIALVVGQIIKIKLPGEWSNILLTARVVRKDENYYACQFVDVSSESQKTLDDGIYKRWRQRVRMKRSKENIDSEIPNSPMSKHGLNVFI